MNSERVITLIAIPILIILVFLLLRLIFADMKSERRYRKAAACKGTVIEQMEDYKISDYGSGAIGVHTKTYRQYKVEFILNGIVYYGVLRTKENNLAPGVGVSVKYAYNEETGQPIVLDPSRGDRVKGLGAAIVFCVLLAGILFFLKSKGFM